MRSDVIKKGFERAPHRSLLKATGVTDADMGKPFVAVCNSFVEIVPGHVHLNKVGEFVKQCALTIVSTESAMISRDGRE